MGLHSDSLGRDSAQTNIPNIKSRIGAPLASLSGVIPGDRGWSGNSCPIRVNVVRGCG